MLDDTCYFLGFDTIGHALCAWAALNNERTLGLLHSIAFKDAKRPFTKQVLMRLDLHRILESMGYQETIDYIYQKNSAFVSLLSQEQWLEFLSSLIDTKNIADAEQLALF